MITVAPNVSLEVVDWGGNGPPLIFLAGLGNTAHIFDTFAPKFLPEYHVFGITRRGYGDSSSPAPDPVNYRADQLGDDVLRVIDSLGLKKPVLVGHSIAGEELSSVRSRYPKRIAGLIYLDAGYPYALYSADVGDPRLDAKEFQIQLGEYLSASPGADRKRIIADLLSQLPLLQKVLEIDQKHDEQMIVPTATRTAANPSEPAHAYYVGAMNEIKMTAKVLIASLALAAACTAQTAAYGRNDRYLLPDRSVTSQSRHRRRSIGEVNHGQWRRSGRLRERSFY